MKVVHISYKRIAESDPERWLNKINFFCGILEKMALVCDVTSVHSIDYGGQLERNNVRYIFIKRNFVDGLFPRKINEQVNRLSPDVVIVHGLGFPWEVLHLQQSLKRSTRVFIQNHAERPFRSHKAWLQKLADRNVNGYFFASHHLAEGWINKDQIKRAEKIYEVMEVSSAFTPMSREAAQKKLSISGQQNYLWVGRLNDNKNPLLVIRAFLQFVTTQPSSRLYVIFQEDDLLSEINNILAASPDKASQITLVGQVDHSDLIYWYNSVDYIISTSFYEGSGVAVCEAMSCVCYPILSDIASFRMMTDNGRVGTLFHSNDQKALVDALQNTTHPAPNTRNDIINWFNKRLSFQAIADAMLLAIEDVRKK
jgi:glycosyltransferase involved in cell wall biosynthesis